MAIKCDVCGAEVTKEELLESISDFPDVELCQLCNGRIKKEFESNSMKHLATQQLERKAIIEKYIKKESSL